MFWVPHVSRWHHLQGQATQVKIGKGLDDAMVAIEQDNPGLKGALPKVYASANPGASYDTWDDDNCVGASYGGGHNPFGTGVGDLPLLNEAPQPFTGSGTGLGSLVRVRKYL